MKISLALICAVTVFSFTRGSPVVHTRDIKQCDPGYTWCKISERCCLSEGCYYGYCYIYQTAAAENKKKVKQLFELEDDVRSSINLCHRPGDTYCNHLRKCCPACGLTSCINTRPLPLKSTCAIPCRYDRNSCCNSNEVCLRTGCHPNLNSNLPPGFVPSTTNEEDRLSAPLKSSCDIPCVYDPKGCCNFNEICLRTGCYRYSRVPELGPPTTNEEDRLSAPLKSSCAIPCRFSPNGCCNLNEACLQTGCHLNRPAFVPSRANEYQAAAIGKKKKVKQSFDELEDDVRSNSCNYAHGDTWCSHLGKCCRYGTTCGEHSCISMRPTPHKSSYKSCIVSCVYSPTGCCEEGQKCKPTGCQSDPFANEKEKDDFNEMIDATNEEYEEFDLQ